MKSANFNFYIAYLWDTVKIWKCDTIPFVYSFSIYPTKFEANLLIFDIQNACLPYLAKNDIEKRGKGLSCLCASLWEVLSLLSDGPDNSIWSDYKGLGVYICICKIL